MEKCLGRQHRMASPPPRARAHRRRHAHSLSSEEHGPRGRPAGRGGCGAIGAPCTANTAASASLPQAAAAAAALQVAAPRRAAPPASTAPASIPGRAAALHPPIAVGGMAAASAASAASVAGSRAVAWQNRQRPGRLSCPTASCLEAALALSLSLMVLQRSRSSAKSPVCGQSKSKTRQAASQCHWCRLLCFTQRRRQRDGIVRTTELRVLPLAPFLPAAMSATGTRRRQLFHPAAMSATGTCRRQLCQRQRHSRSCRRQYRSEHFEDNAVKLVELSWSPTVDSSPTCVMSARDGRC